MHTTYSNLAKRSASTWKPLKSIKMDTRSKSFEVTLYSDGEVSFYSDNGYTFDLTKENIAQLTTFLGAKPEVASGKAVPMTFAPATEISAPSPKAPAKLKQVKTDDFRSDVPPKIERKVAKDNNGWGANILVDGKVVRYYYATRDTARAGIASDKIGVNNRVK